MGYAKQKPLTLNEFLAWERAQPDRYEFVDGDVRLMVGDTHDHRTILGNLYSALRGRVRPMGCRAMVEGPKILAESACLYPDVSVICGPIPPKEDFAENPILIAEVLAPSTEAHDRGAKWQRYQTIPSLRHFLLVSEDACVVEVYSREDGGWSYRRLSGCDQALPVFGFDIPLADIFDESSVLAPMVAEC